MEGIGKGLTYIIVFPPFGLTLGYRTVTLMAKRGAASNGSGDSVRALVHETEGSRFY